MAEEKRVLKVYADSKNIASEKRIRVQGRANMTLIPDFFVVDIYNLEDGDLGIIRNSSILHVDGLDNSTLCYGQIEDVYIHQEGSNIITTIAVSDGQDFWDAKIRKTIGKGAGVRETINAILEGAVFGTYLANNPHLVRGQTFCGRQPEIVQKLAKSVNARPFISHGVLHIVEKNKSDNITIISESDIINDPSNADGTCIVRLTVKGYPVGTMANVRGKLYRIATQVVEADNFSGPWRTDLTLVNEDMISEIGG